MRCQTTCRSGKSCWNVERRLEIAPVQDSLNSMAPVIQVDTCEFHVQFTDVLKVKLQAPYVRVSRDHYAVHGVFKQ